MKRILVPIDFSLPARWAMEAAVNIARRANAELLILHVIEQPTPQSFNVVGEIDETQGIEERLFTLSLIEKTRHDLERWVEDFNEPNLLIKPLLKIGNAYHGISKTITDQFVDLVVMGTTGHSMMDKLFIGSTTDKVVRHSRSPVLTIHNRVSSPEYKHIVYATSIDECESPFFDVIRTAQRLYDATVHLVRINTPVDFTPDLEVKKRLEKFASRIGLANYTINIFNDRSVEDGIIHFAESIDADLIGMATHGRSWLIDVLAGTEQENLFNHSERPVLTFISK